MADEKLTLVCDKQRHLVCVPYSIENLHKMADSLGIKRCWFHNNHYDIPLRRKDEIEKRVDMIVTTSSIVRIVRGEIDHLL